MEKAERVERRGKREMNEGIRKIREIRELSRDLVRKSMRKGLAKPRDRCGLP